MVDWKAKLTSRKFWAAICALVTNLILAFRGSEETAVQVTAIIMAGAAVVAYVIGEGLIDAAAAHNTNTVIVPGFDEDDGGNDAEAEG